MPPKDECMLKLTECDVYVDGKYLAPGRAVKPASLPFPLLGDDAQEMIISAHISKAASQRMLKQLEKWNKEMDRICKLMHIYLHTKSHRIKKKCRKNIVKEFFINNLQEKRRNKV